MSTARPPDLARDCALFLDFDGTLAELAPRPDAVRLRPPLPALLGEAQRLLGEAVAIVTGRALADIDRHLHPARLAGIGVHGAELRRQAGAPVEHQATHGTAELLRRLRERFEPEPFLLVEDKGAAVALHFRQAPSRAQECIDFMREAAHHHGLDVLVGKAVVEARPRGIDKGGALLALMAEPPFRGRRPVFAGDDVTDEEGFAVIEEQGGITIKVGEGTSRARYRLASVDAVHAWLSDGIRLMGGEKQP
jgi:trehalose 6-phosphate phosphatase